METLVVVHVWQQRGALGAVSALAGLGLCAPPPFYISDDGSASETALLCLPPPPRACIVWSHPLLPLPLRRAAACDADLAPDSLSGAALAAEWWILWRLVPDGVGAAVNHGPVDAVVESGASPCAAAAAVSSAAPRGSWPWFLTWETCRRLVDDSAVASTASTTLTAQLLATAVTVGRRAAHLFALFDPRRTQVFYATLSRRLIVGVRRRDEGIAVTCEPCLLCEDSDDNDDDKGNQMCSTARQQRQLQQCPHGFTRISAADAAAMVRIMDVAALCGGEEKEEEKTEHAASSWHWYGSNSHNVNMLDKVQRNAVLLFLGQCVPEEEENSELKKAEFESEAEAEAEAGAEAETKV